MGWFYEVVTVMALSKRIVWALVLGMLGFIAMNLMGYFQLSDFELQGAMAPLGDVVKDHLYQRFDKAAFAILFGSWWTAYKFYKKDKKRILGGY
jgi:hypothetical protein